MYSLDGFLTTKEACEMYDISPTTLWRWVAKGKITQYKDPVSNRSYYLPLKKDFLTIKELCFQLKVSRTTLYRYISLGLIIPIPNHPTSFRFDEIDRFLQIKSENLKQVPPAVAIGDK